MFALRQKDGLGRIGTIFTSHGNISTPILLPVINPNHQTITPEAMCKFGAEAFITNAYLLYKDEVNRKKVLETGLHNFIGFNGPIMTDSGAFQLMEYGEVSVTNSEITAFQEEIQTDIGVFLDIPTKQKQYHDVKHALEETLARAEEHINSRVSTSQVLWAGPIQGGEYLDLVEKSCEKMAKKQFHIHPLGSVVPYLERYDFETVIKMILVAKHCLPMNRPIHLFGAGHPMFFALSVFLGVDIFDSAAYYLYARKNRYLTVFGTHYLDQLHYLPCSCKICSSYSAKDIQQLPQEEKTLALAEHNLRVSFEEIKRIKQTIIEGRLYEMVLSRMMNHPRIAKTLDLVFGQETSSFIEIYTPTTSKRAILISHPILKFQPHILRYKKRIMERFYAWSSKLIIAKEFNKIHSTTSYQVLKLSTLFGVVPDELKGVFPLVQHERIPLEYSSSEMNYVQKFIENFEDRFESVEIHKSLSLENDFFSNFKIMEPTKTAPKSEDKHKLNAIIDYQFGENSHKIFDNMNIDIKRSRKTGILRHFSRNGEIIGTLRPSDFTIILSKQFASEFIKQIPFPKQRVVAAKVSVPFVTQNKDLLAKFVSDVDSNIRSGEEVFIVDKEDCFLNFGRAHLSAKEMISFDKGVAVKVRRK
ncbi:MAG: tRNA guanosine(15) transglycosylase TgtA [Candidatus Hodarchaeales archaeon]